MARLYWMQLKKDFFKRHDIQVIEAMPNGKDYVLFYLKLMCESLDHEGNLRFSDTIPYNEEMLSAITHTNIDIVRSAMKVLISLGLVEIFDDQTIYMSEVQKFIGSESDSAERVRRYRALQGNKSGIPLHCNGDVTECNEDVTRACYTDKEKEAKRNKSIEYRVKSLEEERMNVEKDATTQLRVCAGARARGSKGSYEDVMDAMELDEAVRPICWEFIKHCQLNKHTLTDHKLEDILVYMETHEMTAEQRIEAFKEAISGGYFDIRRY